MNRAVVPIAALVLLVSVSYFAMFRSYGFQLEDEGTLLFQLDRVSRGDRPYLDFATGYTPGFFRVGATLLEAARADVPTLRVFIALVNGATAAAMYVLIAPLSGPVLALAAPITWVALIPVFPGDFASFNIPYPAWFAALCYVAGALVMRGFVAHGGLARVFAGGVLAAVAFSFKINAGAFLLAACTFVVCMAACRGTGLDRAAAAAAVLFMATAIGLTFLSHPTVVDLSVHLVPVLAVAALSGVFLAGKLARADAPRITIALLVLALGFVLPTAAWVVPLLSELGPAGFAKTVLLLGSGAASVYHEGHPTPELYAVVLTLSAVVLGLLLAGRAHRRRVLQVMLAAAVVFGAVLVSGSALMPMGLLSSVGLQFENAIFWLAPISNLAGIGLLAATSARRDRRESAMLAVVVVFAVTMYLQLYPRTDFMHVVMAVPGTLCLATVVMGRLLADASSRDDTLWSSKASVELPMVPAVAIVCVLRVGPVLTRAGAACGDASGASARVALCVETGANDDVAAFRRTVAYLDKHASPGEEVLAFPALTGVLFGAGLASPVPHDYWFPGRPDAEEEQTMLAELRRVPPRFIVTLNSGWGFFIEAPAYFEATRRLVLDEYRLAARFERFDVLVRGDATSPAKVEGAAEVASGIEGITVRGVAERRQGMRRLLSGITPASARDLRLPADTALAVLALRAVRDAGDLRATGLAVQGYARSEDRVKQEAAGAMFLVTASTRAALHRWAGDLAPKDFRPYVEPWLGELRRLADSDEPRVREFARLALELHGPT